MMVPLEQLPIFSWYNDAPGTTAVHTVERTKRTEARIYIIDVNIWRFEENVVTLRHSNADELWQRNTR